jgi:N utilization substance protein B
MGVAEAVAFPQIPIKVTLNEMVEISKFYSTGNSKMFVNGILDRIIKFLTSEGKIEKRGRGLVDK